MDTLQIVVVGSSYSSAAVFYYLQNFLTKARQSVDLVLVADKSFYFFKNLLSQYLSNSCDVTDISQGFREIGFIKPSVSYLEANVLDIDFNSMIIKTEKGKLKYHYLVLSPLNDEGEVDEVFKDCLPPDGLFDFYKIKQKIIKNLEIASSEKELEVKKRLLTFSIIGGKKEGIELACSVSDLVSNLLKSQFLELSKSLVKVNLIEEKNTLVNKDPFYTNRLFYNLNKKGINIFTNTKILKVKDGIIEADGEKKIYGGVVIYSGSDKYSSLIKTSSLVKDKSYFASVDLYLRAQGFEDVFVVGESAKCLDLNDDLLKTDFFFNEQAKTCAYNIFAKINNNPLKPLKECPVLDFVSLGYKNSLVEIRGLYFDGYLGWIFHRLMYIWYLLGTKKKIKTLVSLILNIFRLKDTVLFDVYEVEKTVLKTKRESIKV